MNTLVRTTYAPEDVTILLKDLSGSMKALDTQTREKMIQSGTHYSEMLPLEYVPTNEYIQIYDASLKQMAYKTAVGIAVMSKRMVEKHGDKFVIISLARAGIPVGILAKRYIKSVYNLDIPHYSISIIRCKGIDTNAMQHIKELHGDIGVEHFQFLDGWTGKGAILNQLHDAVDQLIRLDDSWTNLSYDLAVLADPANICKLRGTKEDFLIPSACLNSTVSGLVSRTILRNDLINVSAGDYHGAVYFEDLVRVDRSIEFIDIITEQFSRLHQSDIDITYKESEYTGGETGMDIVKRVAKVNGINDINLIKPGVGETTRVLLRRLPWKVLINPNDLGKYGIEHIVRLCDEKNVPIEHYNLGNYRACGIIKNLSADA